MSQEQNVRCMVTTPPFETNDPMYHGPGGFTAIVSHSVSLDGFPSQWRGPVLAVYCLDEHHNVRVEPRWLTPAGVGVYRGPQFAMEELRDGIDVVPTWFDGAEIDFPR